MKNFTIGILITVIVGMLRIFYQSLLKYASIKDVIPDIYKEATEAFNGREAFFDTVFESEDYAANAMFESWWRTPNAWNDYYLTAQDVLFSQPLSRREYWERSRFLASLQLEMIWAYDDMLKWRGVDDMLSYAQYGIKTGQDLARMVEDWLHNPIDLDEV